MKYAVDPESIQAYRMRVYMLSQELRQEKILCNLHIQI